MRISAPGHFSSTPASLQHISLQSSSILGSIPAHNITGLGSAALHSISCHNSASFHRRSRHLASSPGSTTILLNALRSSPRLHRSPGHFSSTLGFDPFQRMPHLDSTATHCTPILGFRHASCHNESRLLYSPRALHPRSLRISASAPHRAAQLTPRLHHRTFQGISHLGSTARHVKASQTTSRLQYKTLPGISRLHVTPRHSKSDQVSAPVHRRSSRITSRLQFTSRPYRSRLRCKARQHAAPSASPHCMPRHINTLLGCKRSYFPLMVNVYRPHPVERSWPIP